MIRIVAMRFSQYIDKFKFVEKIILIGDKRETSNLKRITQTAGYLFLEMKRQKIY